LRPRGERRGGWGSRLRGNDTGIVIPAYAGMTRGLSCPRKRESPIEGEEKNTKN
jgi:hypothetical protein